MLVLLVVAACIAAVFTVLAAQHLFPRGGPNLDEVLPGDSPAMIETSIVNPSADIAQGFQDGIMPANYGDSIDPADLKLLVKFLYDNAGKPQKGG